MDSMLCRDDKYINQSSVVFSLMNEISQESLGLPGVQILKNMTLT